MERFGLDGHHHHLARALGALLTGLALVVLPVLSQAAAAIVVMGDSLSAAHGIERSAGWVSLLEHRLQAEGYNYEVVNASVSGETTGGGLARLPSALKRHEPAVVILELAANDGLLGVAPAEIEANLTRMAQLAQARGAEVLLLGVRLPPNYGASFNRRFAAVFRSVAEVTGATLVPRFLAGVAEDRSLMQPDGLHPAAAAQPIMLDNVWGALQAVLSNT